MTLPSLLRHPALVTAVTLIILTLAWRAIGAPISLITQIALYTLHDNCRERMSTSE